MDRFLEFAGDNTLLVFALVTSFFLVIITELRRKAAGISSVDPADAVRLINGDATIIDLRTVESYSQGHIVSARNIPMDELDARMGGLQALQSKPILAVCNAGVTSTKAMELLRKAGFESVYSLKGGMSAWSQAGLPVVTGKKTTSKNKGGKNKDKKKSD